MSGFGELNGWLTQFANNSSNSGRRLESYHHLGSFILDNKPVETNFIRSEISQVRAATVRIRPDNIRDTIEINED